MHHVGERGCRYRAAGGSVDVEVPVVGRVRAAVRAALPEVHRQRVGARLVHDVRSEAPHEGGVARPVGGHGRVVLLGAVAHRADEGVDERGAQRAAVDARTDGEQPAERDAHDEHERGPLDRGLTALGWHTATVRGVALHVGYEGDDQYHGRAVVFDLTDEQREIQQLARDFANREVKPVAEYLDREHRFPYEIVKQLGELGLMGIPYPEEYGGGGAGNLAYALAVEEITRIDSSVAITLAAHISLGTFPIFAFGDEEQKREWLPRLTSGEILAAFGLTEPGPAPTPATRGRVPGSRRASGWSTAPSSSSPTPAPTSRAS